MENYLERLQKEGCFKDNFTNAVHKINDDGSITFKLITPDLDRHGQVTRPEGARLNNYKVNPVWLWAHNMEKWGGMLRPPIGKGINKGIEQSKDALLIPVMFDETNDPFALMVANKHRDGFLNAVSAGFIPIVMSKDKDKKGQTGPTHLEFELLEGSSVPIPANPKSLQVKEWFDYLQKCHEMKVNTDSFEYYMKALGWDEGEIKDAMVDPGHVSVPSAWGTHDINQGTTTSASTFKTTTPTVPDEFITLQDINFEQEEIKSFPLAPESTKWSFSKKDSDAILGDPVDKESLQKIHAWYYEDACLLPHHKMINGEIKTVWNGVKSAMGALLGVEGGTDIPDDDKQKVYDHLEKHYKEFNKPVPVLKDYDEQMLEVIFDDVWEESYKMIKGDTETVSGSYNPGMAMSEIRQKAVYLKQFLKENDIHLDDKKKDLANEVIEVFKTMWPEEKTNNDELIKLLENTNESLKASTNPQTNETENDLIKSLEESIKELKK